MKDSMKDFINSGKITSITYNSKEVEAGSLFVCKGVHFEEAYLEEAVRRGAIAYISEKEYPAGSGIKAFIVEDVREAMQRVSELFYGPLYERLKLTGITGTKGKSTTSYFVNGIIDEYMTAIGGNKSALISSIRNYDGVVDAESHLTTPEIMQVYKHMSNAVNCDIEYMTMEISSQAMKLGRVSGVKFDVGCFLNISPDHISSIEHPNYDDYLESKLKLFSQCNIACINLDCNEQERLRKASENANRVITFSQNDEQANIFGYNVKSDNGRISFDLKGRGLEDLGIADFDEHINLAAFGKLNVENALAAIAITVSYGIPFEYIKSGLAKIFVPGRMELFSSIDGKKIVIVDYAHNKLSFEKLIETVKSEFPHKDLEVVFGCVGDKAYSRRQEMGTIAGTACTKTYVTEYNHGEEDLEKICHEIEHYVKAADGDCEIILDRVEAIKKAIAEADDMVVLVIGKGRETQLKRGVKYYNTPTDVEVVMEVLGIEE